jgi:hypothetical protein
MKLLTRSLRQHCSWATNPAENSRSGFVLFYLDLTAAVGRVRNVEQQARTISNAPQNNLVISARTASVTHLAVSLHAEYGHVGLALEEAFGAIPEVDFPDAALADTLQINRPALAALGNVLPDVDGIGDAVVVGDDHAQHIHRRVGHLELDPPEIIERSLYDDRVVIDRMIRVGGADEPPTAGTPGSGWTVLATAAVNLPPSVNAVSTTVRPAATAVRRPVEIVIAFLVMAYLLSSFPAAEGRAVRLSVSIGVGSKHPAGFEQKARGSSANQWRDDEEPHLCQCGRISTHANDRRTERTRRVN